MRFYELNEGISYKNCLDSFEFDFEHDNKTDIIKLTKSISVYKDLGPCTYFGYEFEQDIDKDVKKKIIDYLKYSDDKDIKQLVVRAVNSLYEVVDLSKFKTIIYPESSSKLNNLIINTIHDVCPVSFNSCKLIKELPKNIEFEYETYKNFLKNNGVPLKDIETSCKNVEKMIDNIHDLEYFKIGQNTKVKYRGYLKNFFKFPNQEQMNAYKNLQNSHVLVIDDISTTHATIKYLLQTLRAVNYKCEIVVFCLICNHIKETPCCKKY